MQKLRTILSSAAIGLWRIIRFAYPLVILTFVLVFMIEYLNKGNLREVWEWSEARRNPFQLNLLASVCLLMLFIGLTGRKWAAYAIVFPAAFAISLASGIKYQREGAPLYLWDLFLRNETVDVAGRLAGPTDMNVLRVGLLFLAGVGLLLLIPHFRRKVGVWSRIALILVSFLGLYMLAFDKPYAIKKNTGILDVAYDQVTNYRLNGYLLGSAINVRRMRIDKPDGYSAQEIERIVEEHAPQSVTGASGAEPADSGAPASEAERKEAASAAKPNIIVLLSESFWDPTLLKGVKYSEDPLPFLHSLQKDYPSGWLLSPSFGGSTANAEFEVLSGLTVRFLPGGTIAYNDYMNHETDSLAGILKRQGYTTTSINPFYNWFFNSRNVYKNFGFSKFIASEYFDPKYKGPWLADEQVMDKIIEQTRSTEGADFIFANTMENHANYKDKFSVNPIKVTGSLSAEAVNILENYATGANDADKGLKQLVDYYSKSGEPTIIAFFGDHLPNMEPTLREAGFISGTSGKDNYLLPRHSTPVLVWDNYLPKHKESLRMSNVFLGPYVLALAGRPGSYLTDYLSELYKKTPMIPPDTYYKDFNVQSEDLIEYRRLEYDILFGKRYGYKLTGIRGRVIDDGFSLGYGDPVIEEVRIREGQPGTLEVTGRFFERESRIYLNGQALKTSWKDRTRLEATLPEGGVPADGGEIVVKLHDAWNTVIEKSPKYALRK